MKDFIKNNIVGILVIILFTFLILKKDKNSSNASSVVITIDTNWIKRDGVVVSTPIYIKGERDVIKESSIEYRPSDNYEELLKQFNELKINYLTKNTFQDSLIVDSSKITVTDVVQENKIIDRKWDYQFKYPEITKTITITNPPKRQMYIGGGFGVNKTNFLNSAEVGILYKDKREAIYSLGIQQDLGFKNPPILEVKRYWKIKF